MKLYSYPLFMGLAWGIAYQLCLNFMLKYKKSIIDFRLLFFGGFVSSWVGAKLFFMLFSIKGEFGKYLFASEFWLGGGFVFYGGLVFTLIFFAFYSLVKKDLNFKEFALYLPGLTIGHAIGRIGCFLAGCCFGNECPYPWGVYIRKAARHPVQLYECLFLIILGVYFYKRMNRDNWNKRPHVMLYLFLYSVGRFVIEFYRGDVIRGLYWGDLSSSQWVSIGILAFAGISLLLDLRRRRRDQVLGSAA